MTKPPSVVPPRVAPPPVGASSLTIAVPTFTLPTPEFTGEPQPTIIPPDFKGVNLITGFRGHGKTSYGLKTDNPANILMLDYEDKGSLLAEPLGVGGYYQVMTEVVSHLGEKFDVQAVYDRTTQILNAVPKDRFTTLFIDNAQDLQDGSAQLIRNNPAMARRYGVKPENAESGGYGGAWPGVKYLIKNMFHLANSKGIKVIVVSFQLKGAWKDGRPLFNKFKTTDVSIWHERSILTLAMVEPMPEHFPVPRALVMKEQLSKMEWVSNGDERYTKQVRRLPMALPRAEPRYVYNYMTEGNYADFKNPKPGEMPTIEELGPFTPSFSKEQLMLTERMIRAQQALTDEGD